MARAVLLQRAILEEYVLGRCRLAVPPAPLFRFSDDAPLPTLPALALPAAAAGSAASTGRTVPGPLTGAETVALQRLGTLHLDELETILDALRVARERLAQLPPAAVAAAQTMSLASYLATKCDQPQALGWLPEALTVARLDMVHRALAECRHQWTELRRAFPVELCSEPDVAVVTAVKAVLLRRSVPAEEGLELAAETLRELSEAAEHLVAWSSVPNVDHSLSGALDNLAGAPALVTEMPRTLLDTHAAAFQHLVLTWWSDLRRAQSAAAAVARDDDRGLRPTWREGVEDASR